jgi:IPT/TIG domain-containing protein
LITRSKAATVLDLNKFNKGLGEGENDMAGTPKLKSIDPQSGSADGGDSVILHGTNLLHIATVNFGTTRASNVKTESSTKLTCTTPSSDTGTFPVVATDVYGNHSTPVNFTFTES